MSQPKPFDPDEWAAEQDPQRQRRRAIEAEYAGRRLSMAEAMELSRRVRELNQREAH